MLAVGKRGRSKEFRHPNHPIHGGADFVTHRRKEFTFGATGHLSRFFRLVQMLLSGFETFSHGIDTVGQLPHLVCVGRVNTIGEVA